ncbi:MAG: hypothetical protein ACOYPS_13130 [Phycisphaerales bacterium]
MSKWQVLRDDDDLLEVKLVGGRKYIFLEVIDLKAHTGEGKFYVEVSCVDLDEIPPAGVKEALVSWGMQPYQYVLDVHAAECCHGYGYKAVLGGEDAGGAVVARRAGRRIAKEAVEDLDEAMERPVNKLGSTAAEMMRGDFMSALGRGCAEGQPNARLVAKMYGADPDEVIVDRLPYTMGFLAGKAGQPNEATDEYAPEYTFGWERGVRVARGESSPPTWIKC